MKKPLERNQVIVRTSFVAIGVNLLLVAFKIFVGLLANSIAIVLDAMNNLSDALSSVLTILGTKLAARPPDQKHPFGYGRVEYLTSILISGIVLFAGASFAITSVKKIITPDVTHYSGLTVLIVSVAIVTKILLGTYTKKVGRQTDSNALVASGTDATFDAVISAATLAGVIVTLTTGRVIDGWLGAVISIVILKAGLGILLETLSSIVGRRADSVLTKQMKKRLCTVEGILGAYDLVLHNYGPTKTMGSVNVAVYDWRTAEELHALSKTAQQLILDEFGVALYIGFYAVNSHDDALHALEEEIRQQVKTHPYVLSMHAFYMDRKTEKISFDTVIDFACPDSQKLARTMEAELSQRYPDHSFKIRIDRDYSD